MYQARWQPLLLAIKCPHTFSLPPVVYFSYVHCSTVLNCPRICVCSMNRIAFVASLCSFRIALRSSRPIPESSRRRISWNLRHLIRMWATVVFPLCTRIGGCRILVLLSAKGSPLVQSSLCAFGPSRTEDTELPKSGNKVA
jgi:hypothetical protein